MTVGNLEALGGQMVGRVGREVNCVHREAVGAHHGGGGAGHRDTGVVPALGGHRVGAAVGRS